MEEHVYIVFESNEYDIAISIEEVFQLADDADTFCEKLREENPNLNYSVEPYFMR